MLVLQKKIKKKRNKNIVDVEYADINVDDISKAV